MPIIKKSTYQLSDIIIKTTDTPDSVPASVPSPNFEAERTAFEAELNTLKQDAYQEAQATGYDAGFKAGKDAGFKAGQDAGLKSYETACERLLETLNTLNNQQDVLLEKMKASIMTVTRDIIGTVIQCELVLNPECIIAIITEALSHITEKNQVIIRVHSDDVAAATAGLPRLKKRLTAIKAVTITADDSIHPGGCIIDTTMGYVDATVETKLDAIITALEASAIFHEPDDIDTTQTVDMTYTKDND